jgi:hypothetical protein
MKDTKALKILFYCSLLLNLLFIYVTKSTPAPKAEIIPIEKKKEVSLGEVYDLKNFKSSSYPTQHLERRLDRMYKAYLIDKKTSRNKRYTKEGKIGRDWKRRCTITLRRISVINAHLSIIEETLKLSVGDDESAKQDLDILIEEKQYRDKLMDMSNFYARYLTSYQYDYVVKTQD